MYCTVKRISGGKEGSRLYTCRCTMHLNTLLGKCINAQAFRLFVPSAIIFLCWRPPPSSPPLSLLLLPPPTLPLSRSPPLPPPSLPQNQTKAGDSFRNKRGEPAAPPPAVWARGTSEPRWCEAPLVTQNAHQHQQHRQQPAAAAAAAAAPAPPAPPPLHQQQQQQLLPPTGGADAVASRVDRGGRIPRGEPPRAQRRTLNTAIFFAIWQCCLGRTRTCRNNCCVRLALRVGRRREDFFLW